MYRRGPLFATAGKEKLDFEKYSMKEAFIKYNCYLMNAI
ncbi:hypothetical protein BAOM_3300 [Peribacillus asahii]|uniref:Uncharacterized protein n=1 Tax=Peribacillus asahii TaxID=228899 RepID=A0A3T0KU04_9BACI|nr:hypothetical protein BAOM_3300 [Peribacillus asahii]